MRKIICLIIVPIILLIQLSCSPNKVVTISQVSSNYPIILIKGENAKRITAVKIPLVFRISNNSFNNIKMGSPSYCYQNQFLNINTWGGGRLYAVRDGELYLAQKLQKIGFIKKEFVVYTGHYSTSDNNDKFGRFLRPYYNYMVENNKVTLSIKSIQELKKTHPEIINAFLEGDSILFRFYNGETIITRTFPVEVK